MNTRKTPARRVEENDVQEEIPLQVEEIEKVVQVPQGTQGDKVPIVGGGNDVLVVTLELSNSDTREGLLALAQAMTTQLNLSMVPRLNAVESTMKSCLLYFVRMNPFIFLGSKVGEDPQEFLDVVYEKLEWSGSSDQEQFRFKKRSQTQEEPRSAKVKLEKGGGSQNVKPTCVTCGKRHYGECLRGTESCYGCGKEGQKVRDYFNIAYKGKEGKQVNPSVPKDDAPTKRRVYALRTRREKPGDNDDELIP
ncbi:hypothetical protein EJD97_012228 [Solanum chilense]|uniref:Gag-pol polyprotein n=1 Tax=Solanum chilense TaxID=4083 RepID=A0A6N2CH06_SOLCI|nr:hypothetical protein EJD97_012228 [Solanum chilense]